MIVGLHFVHPNLRAVNDVNMRPIDLIEFIREARLGYITESATKADVKRLFGKPKHVEMWMAGYSVDPIAWVYDDLYFGFGEVTEVVSIIGLHSKGFKQKVPVIGKSKIDCHGIRFSITVDEFETIISNFDINPKEKMKLDENGWVLEFPSGVSVSFQGQIGGEALLNDICINSLVS